MYKPCRAQKSKIWRILILVLSVVVFFVSTGFIVKLCLIDPNQNKSELKEIEEIFYKKEESRGNLSEIQSINPDIKGWIKINDTVIDYPVLQSPESDSTYYLHRNYKKAESGFGSIFLDSLCDINKPSKNLILYGHSMRDGSMFGNILKYDDLEFYKARPTIIFDTINGQGDWKIISVFKTNTLSDQGEIFNYFKIDFATDEDFLQFVYDVKVRSLINTPVDISRDDTLITLSTCSYELKDFRTAVVARKVRPGESANVDVEKATINQNPLMPTGYYEKYGGTAPVINGFENDLKNGNIPWLVK